jgi:hypothetical protein
VKGFDATRSVEFRSINVASRSATEASVAFTVVSSDATASGTVSKTFQGTWLVKLVDGAWKLDVPNIRQVQ